MAEALQQAPFKQTEQQKAQHALTHYYGHTQAIINNYLTTLPRGENNKRFFSGLVTTLFQIGGQLQKQVDLGTPIEKIRISFNKYNLPQGTRVLETLLKELGQKATAGFLVYPSVVDDLYLLRESLGQISLVGKDYLPDSGYSLPKGYQYSMFSSSEDSCFKTKAKEVGDPKLAAFVSKIQSLLNFHFLNGINSGLSQQDIGKLASSLLTTYQDMFEQVNHGKKYGKIKILLGTKENHQENKVLKTILNSLYLEGGNFRPTCQDTFYPSNQTTIIIAPSVFDFLFIKQLQTSNGGSVLNKQKSYYLVGSDHLPENYQLQI